MTPDSASAEMAQLAALLRDVKAGRTPVRGVTLYDGTTAARAGATFRDLDIFAADGAARLADGTRVDLTSTGKGASTEARAWSAVLEICERVAVLEARADARAAFRDLAAEAVAPRRMILADIDEDPDRCVIDWSRAHAVRDGRPVLVPRPVRGERPALFLHTTNGAAAGRSAPDAVLRGLLELVERDAFLTTWYARRPAPTIARPWDLEAEAMAGWLAAWGFDAGLHALRGDLDVPVALAVVTQQAGPGPLPRGGTIVGASAGRTFREAGHGALLEVIQTIEVALNVPHHSWSDWPPHLRRFASEDRRDAFAFLGAVPARPFPAEETALALPDLVARVEARGVEVLAIDRSPEYLARLGMAIVEVVAPGLQPLTLGDTPIDRRIAWQRYTPEERCSLQFAPHPLG